MPTRNVVLTDRQAEFVERLVESGRYQNASEVLREGLRLVEDQESENRARIKALREAARQGVSDIEKGRYHAFDSADELSGYLKAVSSAVIDGKKRGSRGTK
jgi:antitoxin ParD1/3/4